MHVAAVPEALADIQESRNPTHSQTSDLRPCTESGVAANSPWYIRKPTAWADRWVGKKIGDVPMKRAYDKVAPLLGEDAKDVKKWAGRYGKLLDLARIAYEVNLLTSLDLDSTASYGEVHHSLAGEDDGLTYIATAHASDVTNDPTSRAFFDCLKHFGFPAPELDRAKYAKWRVEWDWRGLQPRHILTIPQSQFDARNFETYLDENGAALVLVRMAHEENKVHQEGSERSETMIMRARLLMDELPPSAFSKALFGNEAGALSDVLSQLIKRFGPTATKRLTVTWHEPIAEVPDVVIRCVPRKTKAGTTYIESPVRRHDAELLNYGAPPCPPFKWDPDKLP
jgi:hypothetical protein